MVAGKAVLKFRQFDDGQPTALHFASCKISVHQVGRTFEPEAATPTTGSADCYLIATESLDRVAEHLASEVVRIGVGPMARDGATRTITSAAASDAVKLGSDHRGCGMSFESNRGYE
jgi:hypothetical protein